MFWQGYPPQVVTPWFTWNSSHTPKKIGRLLKKKTKTSFFRLPSSTWGDRVLPPVFPPFFRPLGIIGPEILKQCLCTPGTGTAAVGPDCPVYQARAAWRLSDLPTYRPTLGVSGGVVNAKGGILFFFQKKNGPQLEWLVQFFGREIPDLHRCFFWILASWTSFLWLLDVHVSWFSSQKMVFSWDPFFLVNHITTIIFSWIFLRVGGLGL